MEELKQCPFCGGRAAMEKEQLTRGAVLFRASCQNAYCRICTPWHHSRCDAVVHWNRRVGRTVERGA